MLVIERPEPLTLTSTGVEPGRLPSKANRVISPKPPDHPEITNDQAVTRSQVPSCAWVQVYCEPPVFGDAPSAAHASWVA